MARKTVIRRLFKYLPKNDAMNISRLASAMSTMDQQSTAEPVVTEDLLDVDFVEIPNEE
jgi:recombinational DNA repair protein RecT